MPTALVTGGTRGIGAELCQQLATGGYRVWLCARDATAGSAVAGRLHGDVRVAVCDVAQADSRTALAAQLRAEGETIDALVNNAGIALDGFNADVVARTMAVNFHGALGVTLALMPLLTRDARVVMVSSGLGALSGFGRVLRRRLTDPALDREGLLDVASEFEQAVARGDHPGLGFPSSAYDVSKALLNTLVRVLDRELARTPVLINAVCPGWVRTDMGGAGAPRSVSEGAASVRWAATLPPSGPRGGFFRDGQAIDW